MAIMGAVHSRRLDLAGTCLIKGIETNAALDQCDEVMLAQGGLV
jgi:hypothetical protein